MTEITEELKIRYIRHERLSDDELKSLHDWLGESEANRRELFELERMALMSLQLGTAHQGDRERTYAKVRARIDAYEQAQREASRRLVRRQWIAWCSSVAAAVVIAFVFVWSNMHPTMVTVFAEQESKQVTLPDGSNVWLNQYAEIQYPKNFAKDSREVRLSGEAYFEVTHDAKRPFSVQGASLHVRVLGTKFNFNSHATFASTVSLIEGSVEVGSNSGSGLTLKPGQKAVYDPNTGRITMEEANTKLDAVWHDGRIPFQNATIITIARTLEQLYGIEVEVSPELRHSATYSGFIVKYSSLDSTMSALTYTLPVSYTIRPGHITLRAKRQ